MPTKRPASGRCPAQIRVCPLFQWVKSKPLILGARSDDAEVPLVVGLPRDATDKCSGGSVLGQREEVVGEGPFQVSCLGLPLAVTFQVKVSSSPMCRLIVVSPDGWAVRFRSRSLVWMCGRVRGGRCHLGVRYRRGRRELLEELRRERVLGGQGHDRLELGHGGVRVALRQVVVSQDEAAGRGRGSR